MPLISVRDVHLRFAGPPLLEGATLHLDKGERVCLTGRNGSGKSTLMMLMNGELPPDSGDLQLEKHARVARLPQGIPAGLQGTIFDVVATGAADQGEEGRHRVEAVISRLQLDPAADFEPLSGGNKRRVLLGRALAAYPDVLLLDEPTNHLDLDAIDWLEDFLLRFPGALLFVTHDRAFLQKLATRIVELDRGLLRSWSCDYNTYLRRRDAEQADEDARAERFDRRLSQEEAHIRQGIKARRTRNEGRVRAVLEMRAARRTRLEAVGNVRLRAQQAERSGRLVIEAHDLHFGYGEESLVRGFSTLIDRGDKIGVLGPNGCGKTTLLRLLLRDLRPRQGTVRHGVRLQIAYFDQHREQLDESATVRANVAGLNDLLDLDGRRRHIYSYLQDFLFTPERAREPVHVLSGGERNRLLLARLFARPSNMLVLDEPTNDLDLETLELLEEQLLNYAGTVIIVSHDRALLDNVVTSTFVFDGDGVFGEYVGGYRDWRRQRSPVAPATRKKPALPSSRPRRAPASGPRKLSFAEKRELEALPERIAGLEREQADLHRQLADPVFYQESGDRVAEVTERLQVVEDELAQAYDLWEELEERAAATAAARGGSA